MKVIVACEYSGTVRDAFIARGHGTVSCDLLPTERPGPHIQGDIRDVDLSAFDMMVAHPPCTHLAVSGAHLFKHKAKEQAEALDFVRYLLDAPVARIALENPVSVISSQIRKPDQIIQPYWFGENASKTTCLWLKGLPLLRETSYVPGQYACCGAKFPESLGKYGCPNCNGERRARLVWANQTPSGQNKLGPSVDRWKLRSATYQGIADAMADQWGNIHSERELMSMETCV